MKILITNYAKLQFREIVKYYKFIAGKNVSDKIKINILKALDLIKENPWSGQIEENLIGLNLSHRRIVKGNYKIIYRLEGDIILITDIFDTRRNPDDMK